MTRREHLLAVVVGVIGAVASWARLPVVTRNTVWAEDGTLFLVEQEQRGFASVLFEPYGGYVHVVPRVITAAARNVVALDRYAVVMAAASCAVVGVVAAVVFLCSASVVTWLPARLTLAAATFLLPPAPFEVLGNAANVKSFLLWAVPWVVVHRPRTRLEGWAFAGFVLVAALTDILAAVFLPLVLVGWRDRSTWPVRGAFVVGVAVQLLATLAEPRIGAPAPVPSVLSMLDGWLVNAVLSLWLPDGRSIGRLIADHGWGVAWLAVIPFALAGAAALAAGGSRLRAVAGALALASVGLFVAAVAVSPNPIFDYAEFDDRELLHVGAVRYSVISALCLAALVPLGAAAARERWQTGRAGRATSVVSVAGVVGLVALMLLQFDPSGTTREAGPVWSHEVARAREACRAAGAPGDVELAVAPTGWTLRLPCDVVEG